MLFKSILILLALAVVALSYLPLRKDNMLIAEQQTQLYIDMRNNHGLYLNRESPEKKFQITSDRTTYDENHDLTRFTPFDLTAFTGDSSIKADSLSASLQYDLFTMNQHATLIQASDDSTQSAKELHSELLILNTATNDLHSPGAVLLFDAEQEILADRLDGNYESGEYHFSHQVKTRWNTQDD